MLTKEQVQHIAHLARIELTPEEEERFEHELSAILQFVDQLNEVDTSGVQPMTGGTHLEQVMRKDGEISEYLEHRSARLIDAAPEKKDWWISVHSVFE